MILFADSVPFITHVREGYAVELLGEDCAFLVNDITGGDADADERLAFLFLQPCVKSSELAAQLVVLPERLAELKELADWLARINHQFGN